MKAILVMTNLPDHESAVTLGQALIEQRLAACVNILAPCTSIYHWGGKTETTNEIPLLIKTQHKLYLALEQAIKQFHPYDIPEIIALPVTQGLPAYLNWIAAETS